MLAAAPAPAAARLHPVPADLSVPVRLLTMAMDGAGRITPAASTVAQHHLLHLRLPAALLQTTALAYPSVLRTLTTTVTVLVSSLEDPVSGVVFDRIQTAMVLWLHLRR